MKRGLLLGAAMVVVVSSLWVPVSTQKNRRQVTSGPVTLTEQELSLPQRIGESTATFLNLRWKARSGTAGDEGPAAWLDAPKLMELGFDCHVAATNSNARDHYSSLPSLPAYVVLEYEGVPGGETGPQTRLYAVDAAKDAARLRAKYADLTRWIIVQGVVRIFVQERERWDRPLLPEPRLRGWIEVLPSQIFVPRPHNEVLQRLPDRPGGNEKEKESAPRYSVKVSWDAGYAPWVQDIQLLSPLNQPSPSK